MLKKNNQKIRKKVKNKLSQPQPPNKSSKSFMSEAVKKTTKKTKPPSKIRLKYNKLLNKTWYKWEPYLYKYLNNFLARLEIEVKRLLRVGMWGLITLSGLTLLGYKYNYQNYFAAVAIVLIFMLPIRKFIYKIKKVEEK